MELTDLQEKRKHTPKKSKFSSGKRVKKEFGDSMWNYRETNFYKTQSLTTRSEERRE